MAKILPQSTNAKELPQCFDIQAIGYKNDASDLSLFNTLAQLVPQPKKRGGDELLKRAENRYISRQLALRLSHLGSFLNGAYLRTYHECNSLLFQEGYKIKAKYCNGRWCNNCNRIRTAKMINGYGKQLQAFSEPQFVTLTIPNFPEYELNKGIKTMLWDMQRIGQIARKERMTINGIRKLESTYNADQDTYHPHFHFIIDGQHNSDWLVARWMERNPTAVWEAQNVRDVDNNGMMELFKYTTKIVSTSKRDGTAIYVKALDNIFQALYRTRTFQKMGNLKRVSEDIDELTANEYDIPFYESMAWAGHEYDWYGMTNGEALTGYEPSDETMNFVKNKMII
jgi:hypothetical protein